MRDRHLVKLQEAGQLVNESLVLIVDPLTPREQEVLDQKAVGESNAEIGISLFITERTVRTHMANILGKLQVHSSLEAVLTAQEMGLVTLPHQLSPIATAILALIRAYPSSFIEVANAGLIDDCLNIRGSGHG